MNQNANIRKEALEKEFLEKVRLTVLQRGVMEIALKEGGVTPERIASEFKSFFVQTIAGKTFIAKMKRPLDNQGG